MSWRNASGASLAGVLLAGSLAGCNVAVQYHKPVDDLGKRVVSLTKGVPGVAGASYVYDHSVDIGEQIHVSVSLARHADKPSVFEAVKNLSLKELWTSGIREVYFEATFYGPKQLKKMEFDELDDKFTKTIAPALEKKYGPQPPDPEK